MADIKSSWRKLAQAGEQLRSGLEEKAHNLRETTQDKLEEKHMEKLLACLSSGIDTERAAAAGELYPILKQRPEWRERILQGYLSGLLQQSPGAQWAILEILHRLKTRLPQEAERFQKAIAGCLASPHSVVRRKLYHIWALEAREPGQRRSRLEDMRRGLGDPDQEVRYAIAEELLKLARAIPRTMARLGGQIVQDQDWRVAYHGARLLASLAARRPELVVPWVPQLGAALQRQAEIHEQVVEALGYVGAFKPSVVAELVPLIDEQLRSHSMNRRSVAATALGRIGGSDPELVQGSLERLDWMLKGDEWMVHPPVLEAMGRIGHVRPDWFDERWQLIEKRAAGGTDPAVAQAARRALKWLEGEAPPPVIKPRRKREGTGGRPGRRTLR